MNTEFSQTSVCIKKIQTIGHTIPRKLQICYAGYFGHVQTHLPKTENLFEILD